MKDNSVLIYGAVLVVAVLVFAGAAVAIGLLAPPTYDVALTLSANNSGSTIYPYQSTLFNITVTNRGGRAVAGLPVAFYVNGVQRNYSIYGIPAHQSVTIQELYTYTGASGYLFSAAADPGNVLRLANSTAAKKSIGISTAIPERVDVYSSVPNSNIIYTDSFTTSGTGLLSGSLMAGLYNISALHGINGVDNGILAKTYQDIYPYVSVANGAYSVYANGTVSYVAWLQGTLTPREIGTVISSFNKNVVVASSGSINAEFVALSNTVSLCSYYKGGWTRLTELYNNSDGASCLGIVGGNYNSSEGNVLVAALRATRMGNFTASNQVNSSGRSEWQRFYYNNATVLGQTLEYGSNSVAASTLFQLKSPPGVFLSSIRRIDTDVSGANSVCLGLMSIVNGADVCSVALPTTTRIGNQSFGAVYSRYVSSNYTAEVYSLLSESYLTQAHSNAAELISMLGINSSSVAWTSPFTNSCAFQSGFGCRFNGFGANSTVNITITNLNYSSVSLDSITCAVGGGFKAAVLNGTLGRGDNITIETQCHIPPLPVFAARTSFALDLGFSYKNVPMIVNGTLNVTTSG